MLTRNHRQEALSRAYVQAIAARCGLICNPRGVDYGIDLSLYEIRRRGGRYADTGYQLDVQAKSTTISSRTATHVLHDLDVKTYDDLREPNVGNPRVLVLLVLPHDESEWISQTEEELLLRNCAYWLSLRSAQPTSNRRSVRIALPRLNVFSPEALQGLMDRVRKGEEL